VNLFNLIALPGAERAAVLADVKRRSALVARPHAAASVELPNTGILLTFVDAVPEADPDQCFKVVCAALLLAEMLDELNESRHAAARPELKFRFGIHVAARPTDAPDEPNADAIHDTLILSAVAPEGSIAASREAFERLPRPERFVAEVIGNPILKTLTTSAHDRCVIVSAAADAYGAALDRQAELLRAQEDSISTPSTF
jgi:hypothetical protein